MKAATQKTGFLVKQGITRIDLDVLLVTVQSLKREVFVRKKEVAYKAYFQVLLFLINFHYKLGNVFLGRVSGPET